MKDIYISLAMIVKNEATRLARCLESAKDIVDEIVIVDTGSQDATPEIARNYTEKVYAYAWDGDFAAARNYAIEQCRGRWILSLDADEMLHADDTSLKQLLKGTDKDAFFLPLLCPGRDNAPTEHFIVLRLFRNRQEYRFIGRIHEQIPLRCADAAGLLFAPSILHLPVSIRERNRRRNRNLRLLRSAMREQPGNSVFCYYCAVEWHGLRRYQTALHLFAALGKNLPDFLSARVVKYRIDCLKCLGRSHEALCLCMEEILVYPMYSDLYFEGGLLLEQRGQYAAAAKWFAAALSVGVPPAQFSHTQGTAEHFALYHLGVCAEKQGRAEEAQSCYDKSLAMQPEYLEPLSALFFYQLRHSGGANTLQFFSARGDLAFPARAAALEELFYAAGHTDLGAQCLAGVSAEDRNAALRALHDLTFGGWEEIVPIRAAALRRNGGALPPKAAADETAALLLLGRMYEAKERILSLWRDPACRSAAWALYLLYRRFTHTAAAPASQRHRRPEVEATLLYLLDGCCHALPASPRAAKRMSLLAKHCLHCLAPQSAADAERLADFWHTRAREAAALMTLRFGSAERDQRTGRENPACATLP